MSRRAAAVRTTVVVATLLVGVAFVTAPWLGIGRAPVLAAVLPARSLVTVGLAAVGLSLLLVAVVVRRVRLVAASVGVVVLVVAVANTAVLGARGWDVGAVSGAGDSLRVFEWNTNGGLVGPQGVARAALSARADVVVLPDAGDRRAAAAVARSMGEHGRPVRLFMRRQGAQVAVLVRADLASGASMRPGVDPVKTMTVSGPSIPTIVAVHAPQPMLPGGLAGWRTDLRWIGEQCGRGADVIVSGDFNGSVDSFDGGRLGSCRDAASAVHAAALGTWPTWLDPRLAMPIDHTLVGPSAGPSAGVVRSWSVLTAEDHSGARHRPTLTVVTRT
ncbi:endonuclease/exonuclease/phosphatase family protein [Curtobacterium sp. VKM Ac-2889]|uniref:endonuclease/exonuclease/phosphatase family protein n=1 Tax=unclassified Curtobacterium TaxID=257496 RepID=UPI00188A6CAA|nr:MULTISPECIES: endonuclease/exonuclease/phosphatase family protein [unclassified Curtobacterium]MBF4597706.1 endonuclease/exonuclease/phosphatase family protein [Curtobacterium sp. VKM Ac-1796]MBF4611938.1 endonuclease/exonuclease/phosphatase family protein [Curtobacterium sp. VKM Ac-2889]